MANQTQIKAVRDIWTELKKRVAKKLAASGFVKRGDGFWRETPDGDAFTGLTFGAKQFKSKSERIDVSFRILGGRREFHTLAGGALGEVFRPSIEAAQFAGYLVDGNRGKQWELLPSTSVDEVFGEISERLDKEAIPKAEAILDRSELLSALKEFSLTMADSPLSYDEAIRLLVTTRKPSK